MKSLRESQLTLDKVNAILRGKKIDPNSVVKSQSYLMSLLQITNSKSRYEFNLKSDRTLLATEIGLDRNDVFFADRMGYGIKAVVSGEFGRSLLQTYPNQTAFPPVTTVGSEFTPDDLEVFWNAQFTLKVGNTVFIPNLDTSNFRFAPETQKSAGTNYDEKTGDDGFIDLAPQLILNGEANIVPTVEAPYFNSIEVANSNANSVNYLAIIFRGYLLKEVNSYFRN